MKDKLIKALARNGKVRVYICSSTQLVEEARKRFDMYPTSLAALGRVFSVASMMGSMLKSDKEKLSIQINGGGPIGSIIVDSYYDGYVRGFVSDPHILLQYNDSNKLAVGVGVGNKGTLEVIKDFHMKENWKGCVELQSGEIGDDFAYYFTVSEQTPSALSVGVLVNPNGSTACSGGLLIQMMPDASEDDVEFIEEIVKNLLHMSNYLQTYESLEKILDVIFKKDIEILSEQPIGFRCTCDATRMKRALTTLPKSERLQMIEEEHGCEITCNFCNEKYHFNEQELIALEEFIDTYAKK